MSYTWRWLRVITPIVIVLPIILACPTRPIETPLPSESAQTNKYYPQSVEKDVDILFVIDNSNSMEQEQVNLAEQFPKLIEGLRSVKLGGAGCSASALQNCRIPNVHIGVISSDMGAGNYSLPSCEVTGGEGGKLQVKARKAGCIAPKDPWISYIEGVTNVDSTEPDTVKQVRDAFACIAEIGVGGCGFEAQLEAARRALDPAANVNPGFLRPEAYLAIVWITDEDDCSAKKPQLFDPAQQGLTDPMGPLTSFRCTEFGILCDGKSPGRQAGPKKNCVPGQDWLHKVDDYVEAFYKLKAPGRVILFAIAGPTEPFEVGVEGANPVLKPSCQSQMGFAVPGIRLKSVVHNPKFGDNGLFNGVSAMEEQFCRTHPDECKKNPVTICSNDFGPALQRLGELIVASLGGQCINAPPLTKNSGIACQAGDDLGNGVTCAASCLEKVDCNIEEITGYGTSAEQTVLVEKCPPELFDPAVKDCGGTCPCWRIVPSSECTVAKHGSPYGLQILRKGEAPKGTMAKAACATSPLKWGSTEFSTMAQCN